MRPSGTSQHRKCALAIPLLDIQAGQRLPDLRLRRFCEYGLLCDGQRLGDVALQELLAS